MPTKSLQRQVKLLTDMEQREIVWDLVLEFRQLVMSDVHQGDQARLQDLINRTQNLKISISNILHMAGKYFQPKHRKNLERIRDMIDEFHLKRQRDYESSLVVMNALRPAA